MPSKRSAIPDGPSWASVLLFGFAVAGGTRILISDKLGETVKGIAWLSLMVFAYAVCNRVTAAELARLAPLVKALQSPLDIKDTGKKTEGDF